MELLPPPADCWQVDFVLAPFADDPAVGTWNLVSPSGKVYTRRDGVDKAKVHAVVADRGAGHERRLGAREAAMCAQIDAAIKGRQVAMQRLHDAAVRYLRGMLEAPVPVGMQPQELANACRALGVAPDPGWAALPGFALGTQGQGSAGREPMRSWAAGDRLWFVPAAGAGEPRWISIVAVRQRVLRLQDGSACRSNDLAMLGMRAQVQGRCFATPEHWQRAVAAQLVWEHLRIAVRGMDLRSQTDGVSKAVRLLSAGEAMAKPARQADCAMVGCGEGEPAAAPGPQALAVVVPLKRKPEGP